MDNQQQDRFKSLIQFTLEQATTQPVPRRIELYRSLAAICGDVEERKQLLHMASLLEASEKYFREFVFSFSQKTT